MKKTLEVAKFGGTESLGTVKKDGFDHEVSTIETQSKTNLEMDEGHGAAVVIRCFEFAMNPEAIKYAQPTKQTLFNSHYKGIEMALWRDGLKVIPESNPRILIDSENMRYKIFVGAKVARGHLLKDNPQTLKQIVHGQ